MKNKTILDYRELLLTKKSTIEELHLDANLKIKDNLNFNMSLTQPQFNSKFKNFETSLLSGVPYSLKDNIVTKNIRTTGGSLFLKDFIPTYNSTIKNILDNCGATLVSKDNLDEFGLGGTGTFSAYGLVINPLDKTRITGGSSAGSSVMVKLGIVPYAIGTDTGDSIRKPVSNLGLVGFKPTYGTISRNGVYPYAPTIDHVGIIANNVNDIAIVLSELAKKDENDMTSISHNDSNFYKNLKVVENQKYCIFKEVLNLMHLDEKIIFENYLRKLEQAGIKIDYINFSEKLLGSIDTIYQIISYAEAVSCYQCFTGITFGDRQEGRNFDEVVINSRTKNFGKQLKKRFIIGAVSTSAQNFNDFYLKAKKIRTLLLAETDQVLKKYDVILMPGASRIAELQADILIGKTLTNFCDDALQIANFGGYPSITIPAIKFNNLPVGINITTKLNDDQLALNVALTIEKINEKIYG